jgi:hypothetical protein
MDWFDGWDLDSEGNRTRFNPRTDEMPGYIPISGTPGEYKAIPAYAKVLRDGDFTQRNGQWYMSTDAQGRASSVMERTGGLGKMLNNGAGFWALAGAGLGGALGGAFPGIDVATGASIPAGQTGILSQLGLQNPFSNLPTNPTGQVPPGSETWGVNPRGLEGFITEVNPFNTVNPLDAMNFPAAGGAVDWASLSPLLNGATAGAPFAFNPLGDSLWATAASNPTSWVSKLTSKLGDSVAKSTLGKLLTGDAGVDDYAKILGSLGSAGLGLLGANAQSDALTGVSDKYLAMGQPYRSKLASTFDPSFSLMNEPGFRDAMDVSTKGVLSKLSANVGNPYDNPGAVSEAQKYIMGNVALPQLNTLRSQLGTFGQLGTNIAGTADMADAGNAGQGYDALGYGLGQLTNDNNLESILKKYGGMLGQPALNLGRTF